MKKFLMAAALLLASFAATAGSYSSSRSSFSSSSFRSSYTAPSRSYSAPSRSYAGPSRSYFSGARTAPSVRPASRPATAPRNTTVVNRTVVNRTTVVNRGSYSRPHYSYYSNPAPRPSFVQSNAGWYAFGALAAWNLLSAHERANTPAPDVSGLMEMSWDELSRAIWADGSMSKAEAAVVRKWRELHGAGQ
ncbi:hypothetical protein [Stenotrophomonas muris]|uniref:hypothetical protein n=1 Tax=Stenotrophomonas muris TaxID=2963283 RepID=UPI004055942A